jgi:hypothetical protein
MSLHGLVKLLAQPVPFRLAGILEQFLDQRLNRRQMIVTGAPPGDIFQEAVDFLGDTPTSRVLQPAFGDGIIEKVNALRDRALDSRHA